MTASRDPDRLIQAFLREGEQELQDQVYDAVRAEIEHKRQRVAFGPWRVPDLNKIVGFGLAAAAVVAAVLIGSQLLDSPANVGGPGVEPTSSSGDGSLPVGLHVMDPVGAVLNDDRVTVTIPAPGWFAEPDGGSVTKDLGGDDRVTVVVTPGDYYQVPGDICNWSDADLRGGIIGDVDELVAALTAQTYDTPEGSLTREFSTPVHITIDGYPVQSITGVLPVYRDSDPDGCDQQRFCSLLDRDGDECLLSHLEPGALDTIWIVGDPLRVVAASYWPTTSSELRAEMNAIVDSMTFFID